MSFVPITGSVWIMPAKITGNTGRAWIANIAAKAQRLESSYCPRKIMIPTIRCRRHFLLKTERLHLNCSDFRPIFTLKTRFFELENLTKEGCHVKS